MRVTLAGFLSAAALCASLHLLVAFLVVVLLLLVLLLARGANSTVRHRGRRGERRASPAGGRREGGAVNLDLIKQAGELGKQSIDTFCCVPHLVTRKYFGAGAEVANGG